MYRVTLVTTGKLPSQNFFAPQQFGILPVYSGEDVPSILTAMQLGRMLMLPTGLVKIDAMLTHKDGTWDYGDQEHCIPRLCLTQDVVVVLPGRAIREFIQWFTKAHFPEEVIMEEELTATLDLGIQAVSLR